MSRIACALTHATFLLSLCSFGSLRITHHIDPPNSVDSPVTGNRYPSSPGSRGAEAGSIYCPCYYNPPQIHYSTGGGWTAPQNTPYTPERAYCDILSDYFHRYKYSSSKYRMLLAGLARRNLVMLTAQQSNRRYQNQPGEVCTFGVRPGFTDYKEMTIPCELISSFIWAEEEKNKSQAENSVNTTLYTWGPDGSPVRVDATSSNIFRPNIVTSNVSTSPVTAGNTTTHDVRDVFDPEYDGPPIELNDDIWCYIVRYAPTRNMGRMISCTLLQTYGSDAPSSL